MDRDRGDEDVEPWDGKPLAAESPSEGDGAVPVVFAAAAVGDDRKALPEMRPFLQTGAAQD